MKHITLNNGMKRKNNRKKKGVVLFLALSLSVAGINSELGYIKTEVSAAEKIEVTSLKLIAGTKNVTKKTYSMTAEDKVTIKVTAKPTAAVKNVTFKSNDKSVVTVTKRGVVTAKKAGAANITVTVSGKKYKTKSTWMTVYVRELKEQIPEETTGNTLGIAKQGMFSSGGTVTAPVEGTYDSTTNWMDATRAGNTAHIDHANVFYQIPVNDNGKPIVYLHGYGQSRMGWMTTPDGREGWSDLFLKKGHAAFLVDQPRRGEAGATTSMTKDGFLDAWAEDSKDYKPGDQAWYTHFRIGRTAPERYEGSQFPEGEEAQNQFFRQMTPNTGDFDQAVDAAALGAVMEDVYKMTGNKSIFITHSQGGAVGWDVPVENISAIVAIEPGGTPQLDSEQYKKLLEAKIPITIYFGDYIDNGPEDIMSTDFWKSVRDGAVQFAEKYNADGGDCTIVNLPDEGITGNSHFMFQELNNDIIADHIESWIQNKVK